MKEAADKGNEVSGQGSRWVVRPSMPEEALNPCPQAHARAETGPRVGDGVCGAP